jgi:hypothetical protein
MTAKEHARALKDLELGYKDMAVEVKEIEAETEAMNSEWISFAVNTATTVVFSLTTITTALGAERVAKIGSALATNIATIANRKFVMSLWAIAKHPVFLIATAGLAIWESNLFGLRSEIEKWSGMDDLSLLSNLEKTFSSGIPEAGAETIDSLDEIEKKAEELQESFDETTTQSNKGIIPMITDVGDCSVKSARKVDTLSDSIDKLKKKQQTFRADYVVSETKFQEQVKRIKNKSMSSQAYKTGLSSLVNYNNAVGGTMNFGHSLTNKLTDPMKHWNGSPLKYRLGGNEAQNHQERHDQAQYNASISGYDNNSTKGWSASSMQTLRNFKARVAEENARLSSEHYQRKANQKKAKQEAFKYFDRWNLRKPYDEMGTRNWKPIWRSIGTIVAKNKRRRAFLQKAGYDTSTPEALEIAESQYTIQRQAWVTQTGMEVSGITKLVEADRRTDIFNIIEHRRRLGLISSGVI